MYVRSFTLFSICFFSVFGMSQNHLADKEQLNASPVYHKKDTVSEISLLFAGDFMGHMDQIKAAYDPDTDTYDYDASFGPVVALLSDADVTIGNLEVTLGTKPYSGYPQFSSPAAYAVAIKNAGVDVLVTANNHACDKRKKGVERTIRILDSLGIGHTGTFYDQAQKDSRPAYFINKNNILIALLNYTYGTNGIDPTPPNIVNYLDKATIKADIEKVKKYRPDQIIAFVHWGDEYKNTPGKSQTEMFDFFRENGVNIVIGAHPHVVQPMHWYKAGNKTAESLVVYSLGNFVSHQRTFPRDGGAVFKLILNKDAHGKISIKNATYTLTWVHEPVIENKKHYYVLPARAYEDRKGFFKDEKHYEKMLRFTVHASSLLNTNNTEIGEEK